MAVRRSEFTGSEVNSLCRVGLARYAHRDTDRGNRTDVRRISANAQAAGRTVCRMTPPSPGRAPLRPASPAARDRRGAAVLVLLAGAVAWAAWPTGPVVPHRGRCAHRPLRARRRPAGRPGHDALPAGRRRADATGAGDPAGARLRRHQGQRRRRRGGPRRPRLRRAHLDRAGLRPQRRADPPEQPRLRGTRRPAAAGLAGRPARDPHATAPATRGSAWSAARTAAALALMLAGQDQRVDAIVPMITWNDLARVVPAGGDRRGAGRRACSRSSGPACSSAPAPAAARRRARRPARAAAATADARPAGAGRRRAAGRPDPQCGRFAADVCAAYLRVATTGRADARRVALLRRSSPASVLDRIKAPTLLIQGEADSLFPLPRPTPTRAASPPTGTPVRVAWFTGGHDGGAGPQSDQDRLQFLTAQWLDHYLKGEGDAPATELHLLPDHRLRRARTAAWSPPASRTDYPGLDRHRHRDASPSPGRPQPIANPPDGTPAAISTLPGAGGLSCSSAASALDLPGQHAGSTPSRSSRPWTSSARRPCGSGPRRRPARRCCSSSSTTSTRTAGAQPARRPGRAGPAHRPAGRRSTRPSR